MSRNTLSRLPLTALLLALAAVPLAASCNDGGAGAQGGSAGAGAQGGAAGQGGSAGAAGQGGTGGAPDCVMIPMTHVEIINACTDAEKVDKKPVLPLLNPDGSLPPLP